VTDNRTNDQQAGQAAEPKRISLAEAVKQKLAQKKSAQANANKQGQGYQPEAKHVMKSQNTKKINNQRKRMGV